MKSVHMIGNAHLDLAWIWPMQEGLSEIKATFLSALERMDEFDDFLFSSASAMYFRWLEQNAPQLFHRVKARVAQGRLCLCGGWWVQPDCNLPCGESFVRQALHGQRYFYERFGQMARIGYNVDSFGHNAGLPQILQSTGASGYVFLRPGPHEQALPNGAFLWQGVDGTQVPACRIPVNYSSLTGLAEHIEQVLGCAPEDSEHLLCFFGVGNHGGGPTIENIRLIQKRQDSYGDARLIFSTPNRFFDAIRSQTRPLPVHCGELLHHAVGCYSSVSALKQMNRKAENSLLFAEKMTALARLTPLEGLTFPGIAHRAWEDLLTCQFHDILAGASLPEVCAAALNRMGGVCAQAEDAASHAMQAISFAVDIPHEEGVLPLVVFNPHPWPVTALITHEKGSWGNPGFPENREVVSSSGQRLPHQMIRIHAHLDERERIAFRGELPPMGYETFFIRPCAARTRTLPSLPDHVLENSRVRLTLDQTSGAIRSCLLDGQEMLSGLSARFVIIEDASDSWSHGVQRYDGPQQEAVFERMDVLERGEVLQRIQTVHRYRHSWLRQRFTLYADAEYVDVQVDLNWQEPRRCLKLVFDANVSEPQATWEVPFGAIVRPTDGHEQPMQSWVDLSDPQGLGLTIANDGKGGAHVDGSRLALTVLRSAAYAHHAPHTPDAPDDALNWIDLGAQSFSYRLIPHASGWRQAQAPRRAAELNQPPQVIVETYHRGELPQRMSALQLSAPSVAVSCLKPAYEGKGLILRLHETDGLAAETEVSLLNLKFSVQFHPYEAKTYLIDPDKGDVKECDMLEFPLQSE